MRAIYEPKGAAREYAPLAVNLYSGCSHGCTYCYAPSCLRRSREDFTRVSVRSGIMKDLAKDSRALAGDPRPVLLSFTSDPYQKAERSERVTSQAIGIMADSRLTVRLLTKNPGLALELDRDLLARANVEFGSTVLFVDDAKRARWEPHAPSIDSRIAALRLAHDLGLRTWVSLEPVIDPAEALRLIEEIHPCVDVWKIGRWNHDKRAEALDWPLFASDVLTLLEALKARYYIKDGLWRSAGDHVRATFCKERLQ